MVADVRSSSGVPVRLTEERWRHVIDRHPEMENRREKVLETLAGLRRTIPS